MASAADGKVVIDTQLNNKGFTKGVSGLKNKMGGLTSVVKKLGAAVASAFAVKALIDFGKEAIELGSNVAEVQNVVDTAFGDMAYKVEAFSETAIQNFGMSRLAAKKTASTYMAMAKGMGLAEETASNMAISLAGMTGDVASFYNISQEAADTKLKSVFTGESESLKELGVVMTQTNLQAYALEQGITKKMDAMSQAELVALRYGYVMKSLSLAQGDFAKTSKGWANQTRILSMQWEEFMSIVGQALVTVLTPTVRVLNQIVSSLINMATVINSLVTDMFGGEQQAAAAVSEEIDGNVESQEAMTEATKETAKAQKKLLAGFDEINKLGGGSKEESEGGAGLPIDVPAFTMPEIAESDTGNSKIVAFFEKIKEVMQPTIDALGRLWERLKLIGGFAGDALVYFYENFLAPVGRWVLNEGLPNLIDAITNGLDHIINIWGAVQPALEWFWESFLKPIGSYVINETIPDFFDGLNGVLDVFRSIWADAKQGLEWLWENFLQPVAEWTGGVILDALGKLSQKFKEFGDWCRDNKARIEDIVIAIASFAAAFALVNGAVALWTVISGGAAAVTTALGAAIAFLTSPITIVSLAIGALITVVILLIRHWDEVKEAAGKCWDWIKKIWQNVATWFNEKIFGPVSNGFKGFVNGLLGMVEGFVNFFVRGINRVIEAANKLSFDLPDWIPGIGGKSFGINIPKISEISLPRLATGAVVPPNREFMAVLGDNKTETEVVSPLSTMKQALKEALQESGGMGGNWTITIKTGPGMARYLSYELDDENTRKGGKLVVQK